MAQELIVIFKLKGCLNVFAFCNKMFGVGFNRIDTN